MTKPLVRTCVICGHRFITRCTRAKYCPNCRTEANDAVRRQRRRRKAEEKRLQPRYTYYICRRCGGNIKAHGICTNRKICNACLEHSESAYDRHLLEMRKVIFEEVI